MKIKEGFEMRTLCREHVVLAKGLQNVNFNKIISLNESAAYLWEAVQGKEFTPETLAELLQQEYEVDKDTALGDATEMAKAWIEAGICEE